MNGNAGSSEVSTAAAHGPTMTSTEDSQGEKVSMKEQAGRRRSSEDDEDDRASLHELEESAGFLQDSDGRPMHRGRTMSVSSMSAFVFERLPLPLSSDARDPAQNNREVKHLGLTSGISLVVGMQIGSGIFSTPGILLAHCGSVGASLMVWLVAGLLAWTGASSFAELGSAIPLNGGAQAYLRYAYGPTISYLFSWTAITALKPGSAAIIAIIFGEYLCRILYHTAFSASSEESAKAIPAFMVKLVAMLAICAVAILNAISLKAGTSSQVFFMVLKLLALLAVAIMGLVQLGLGRQSESLTSNIFEGSTSSPGRYALALYSGLWSFDGWDQACFVAGEMKDVSRDLPRVIHISMAMVIVLYLTANVSYFIVLPPNIVAHSNTIGLDFGKTMFGPVGGAVFAVIVAISCFGALNSHFFTSARLIFVAGKEGYLPKVFAQLNEKRRTPVNALMLQSGLIFVMIIFGDFASLVSFFGFSAWLFYLLTVLGLLVLRNREPNLPRPYRTYLITPIVFCCVALFLLFMPLFSAPLAALAAFGFIATGYPVYLITQTKPPQANLDRMLSGEGAQPLTRTEKVVEQIRSIPQIILGLFGKRTAVQEENRAAYAAVELDDLEDEDEGDHDERDRRKEGEERS